MQAAIRLPVSVASLITTLVSLMLLTSCGPGDLDRENAKELLTQHYKFPLVEFDEARMQGNTDARRGENKVISRGLAGYSATWVDISELVRLGLIDKTRDRISLSLTSWGPQKYAPSWRYHFTPLCSQYMKPGGQILQEGADTYLPVKLCEVHLMEVVGIRLNNEKTSAQVDYIIERREYTPLRVLCEHTLPQEETISATFDLYDDGWRIRKEEQLSIIETMSLAEFNSMVQASDAEQGRNSSQEGREEVTANVEVSESAGSDDVDEWNGHSEVAGISEDDLQGRWYYEKTCPGYEVDDIEVPPGSSCLILDLNVGGVSELNQLNKKGKNLGFIGTFSWELITRDGLPMVMCRHEKGDSVWFMVEQTSNEFHLLSSGKGGMGERGDKWLRK